MPPIERDKSLLRDYQGIMLNNTLHETNIALENRPSQKEIGIPTIHFHVLR